MPKIKHCVSRETRIFKKVSRETCHFYIGLIFTLIFWYFYGVFLTNLLCAFVIFAQKWLFSRFWQKLKWWVKEMFHVEHFRFVYNFKYDNRKFENFLVAF